MLTEYDERAIAARRATARQRADWAAAQSAPPPSQARAAWEEAEALAAAGRANADQARADWASARWGERGRALADWARAAKNERAAVAAADQALADWAWSARGGIPPRALPSPPRRAGSVWPRRRPGEKAQTPLRGGKHRLLFPARVMPAGSRT